MATKSTITLIDLSKQLPFALDDKLKADLCFAETLIISCGHYEGDFDDASSESEWTCRETTPTVSSVHTSEQKEYQLPPSIEESIAEEVDTYNDFHFFFFPDCNKPVPPQHSKDSILMADGFPKLNPVIIQNIVCTCEGDKEQCECFKRLPCNCGALEEQECICRELKDTVCICKPLEPKPVCTCEADAEVCTCQPGGVIFPECYCDKVEKPCICPTYPFKLPSLVCSCKRKPTISSSSRSSFRHGEEGKTEEGSEIVPCECQKPAPKQLCYCTKGKECICKNSLCICGVQHTCVCEPTSQTDIPCKMVPVDDKSICSCEQPPPTCTCDNIDGSCKCFPPKLCTCGNPQTCKCFSICDCKDPCLCGTVPKVTKACTCVDSSKVPVADLVCICPKQEDNKIKRTRAGKHGYKWCHEVDPRHTFFDYGYDQFDKINTKEPEPEKLVIQDDGVNDHPEECPVHQLKVPKYEKKVRKPSLDCCSAVGGISICVELIGEDKDKFLVQVVSYSSKEGAKTGSKLVSILDSNLHTMEENRSEYITKKNLTKEKRSYMAICENGYYNKVTRICGDKHVIRRIYHSFEEAHDFLLEGANILLMRYLGLSRYRGNVKTATVLIDGVICQSIYVCHGVSQGIVNGTPLFVVKVERHIIEPTGFVHQTLMVLTLRGYIVSQEWADTNYIMHLNPLLQVDPQKDEIEPHVPLREKWREDLQLLSDYLDFKTIRSSEGGRYMMESGSLTSAVRDYLQSILMLRPQDTLCFTRHYFKTILSALDIPHEEYFDPPSRHVRYYFFEE